MIMTTIALMKMLIALTSQQLERFISFYFFEVEAEGRGINVEDQSRSRGPRADQDPNIFLFCYNHVVGEEAGLLVLAKNNDDLFCGSVYL